MNDYLNRLKTIEHRAKHLANMIDVSDIESEKRYSELAELSNELGKVINALEVTLSNNIHE